MKKIIIHLVFFFVITALLISCSTKKDLFLNRALHSTATKYNILYNGKEAYKVAKQQLDDNYEDDFYITLPIEPLKVKEKIELPSIGANKNNKASVNNASGTSGSFSKAEEKAVKAVQKHSMSIVGVEKNNQIDDAYLLLGKSRYFDQRFIPALETFNYFIKKYPESPLIDEVRIWEAKCLTRLGNEIDAIGKLTVLLDKKETTDPLKVEVLTALAMAYTNQDEPQMIINMLNKSLRYETKDHNQKARNLFILGQLYRSEHKIDSSNLAFTKLIRFKKSPYRYKVRAQLEKTKNYDKTTDSTAQIVKTLLKLSKNRDNRPFLDGIYFNLAKIHLANDSINEALVYFEKSLRAEQAHDVQKGYAYENIGNIKFDQAAFLPAGAYYDSVISITPNKNNERMRSLVRKRKGLDEVIQLEYVASTNDSILNLVSLSKKEQTIFFNKYIEELKKKEKEANIIAENKKKSNLGSVSSNLGSKQRLGGKFYFYNAQTVGFGQMEFKKVWGDRPLADNWRLSEKKSISNDNEEEESTLDKETKTSKDEKYEVDFYLSQIPSEQKVIDSLSRKRNDSYYRLGLIYKEKFKKDELSTKRLEKLLSFNPNIKLVLPSYYHLYKAFESFDVVKSDFYKTKILNEYADSRYAQLINNPDFVANSNLDSPEEIYNKTYQKYTDKQYSVVLVDCNKNITNFANDDIVPKFELLKAYAIAKTQGRAAFIKALTFVAINYPNLEEGIHASNVLASLNGKKKPVKKVKSRKLKNKKIDRDKSRRDLMKSKKSKKLTPPKK